MTIVPAKATDAPAIAALHAASWQVAYRGDFPDHYLDVECPDERLKTWTERFAEPNPKMVCRLARQGDELLGFCCTFLDYDEHGSYLDNLHVQPGTKGKGVGKAMLLDALELARVRGQTGDLYLWVLTSNAGAIGFYEHLGGELGDITTINLAGNEVEVIRVTWPGNGFA